MGEPHRTDVTSRPSLLGDHGDASRELVHSIYRAPSSHCSPVVLKREDRAAVVGRIHACSSDQTKSWLSSRGNCPSPSDARCGYRCSFLTWTLMQSSSALLSFLRGTTPSSTEPTERAGNGRRSPEIVRRMKTHLVQFGKGYERLILKAMRDTAKVRRTLKRSVQVEPMLPASSMKPCVSHPGEADPTPAGNDNSLYALSNLLEKDSGAPPHAYRCSSYNDERLRGHCDVVPLIYCPCYVTER